MTRFRAWPVVVVVCVFVAPTAAGAAESFFPSPPGKGVFGHYIVLLSAGHSASEAPQLVGSVGGGKIEHAYRHVLNGFEVELNAVQAQLLAEHPAVRSVHQDTYVENPLSVTPECARGTTTNTRSLPPLPDPFAPEVTQQLDCTSLDPDANVEIDCLDNWGIDRVDQYGLPRDDTYTYRQDSTSVTVYVIDTGIRETNREFTDSTGMDNRVADGIDATCDDYPDCESADTDCSGHGTHVAAIAGGRTFGLAKDVQLVPIRWTCGTGETPNTHFINALDALLEFHQPSFTTAIANLSGANHAPDWYDVNDGLTEPIRLAMIEVASRDNILVVQSAGNHTWEEGTQRQACDRTFGDEDRYTDPDQAAAIARIVVAGGSDELDGRWTTETGEVGHPGGSNIGDCVDLFAPAPHVVSALHQDSTDPDAAICHLGGTSMAAPHVAGAAALILEARPDLSTDLLRTTLLYWAEQGALESNPSHPNYIGDGSPNTLVHWDSTAIFQDILETGDFSLWTEEP